MATPITVATLSDVGKTRQQNEDSRGETETAGGNLLIVCDGMGGHEAGEVASRIAVDAITQIFKNSPSEDPAERLKAGFLVANQRILAHAEKGNIESMGTTAVAAFVRDGKAWIAHVGDSRCYQLRGGDVVWKTADHTRVQKMIERGIITADQAKTHEDANVVTRALGFAKGEDKPEPDVTQRELVDGDLLLLCSDGLYDLVKDDEIGELGSEATLDDSTRTLVDLANKRGGHDNITVTILRHGAVVKRSGARKTNLDAPGPDAPLKSALLAKSPVSADDVAKARAEAKAAVDAAQRSRRALILVVAGLALLGIAGAAFVVTRGGDEPTPRGAVTHDASSGSAAPIVEDAGAVQQAVVVDGGAPVSDAGTTAAKNPTSTTAGNKRRDGGVGVAPAPNDAGVGPAASGSGPVLPADASVSGSTTTTTGGGFGVGAPLGTPTPTPTRPPATPTPTPAPPAPNNTPAPAPTSGSPAPATNTGSAKTGGNGT